MKKNDLINIIEKFAPLETQEAWDNSGWQIDISADEIKKVMLCLSVSEDVITQAKNQNCDMIIAHHPLFYIPLSYNKGLPIYSSHTPLDVAKGGTTDTMIKNLGFDNYYCVCDFLRIVNEHISLENLILRLKICLNIPHIRVVNNSNISDINKLAFCAGSGSEFINLAINNGADILITGDIKYHTALDSKIALIDVGHFESEYPVLNTVKSLINPFVEVVLAKEKSPFETY